MPRLTLPYTARLIGEPIHFDPGSAKLNSHARRVLAEIVATLKANGSTRVILVGSADRVGTERANYRLAEDRANVVRAALLAAQIVADVISIGENLATDSATGADLERDRTVSVYVTDIAVTL
jgi:outer membrane protein OmpA-like peptidoglycan-associated protein